jgi:aldose 1-epimerase
MPVAGGATLRIDTLVSDVVEVELLPGLGARLHRLRVFGWNLLRTPTDPGIHLDDPFFWGAYHMVPWAGRMSPGPVRIGRRTVDFAANFRDGTAIHGLHYVSPWQHDGPGVYSTAGGGADGWPWPYSSRVEIAVDGAAVRLRHIVTNLSDEAMPAGTGFHPWFRKPVQVSIPARTTIASNADPDAPLAPVRGEFDLARLAALPDDLDAAWTGVGDPAFELRWPELRISATVRARAPVVYVVAASPRELDAVAVEPQTHAPFGLRRLLDGEAGGLARLDPGAALTLETELSFRKEEEQT